MKLGKTLKQSGKYRKISRQFLVALLTLGTFLCLFTPALVSADNWWSTTPANPPAGPHGSSSPSLPIKPKKKVKIVVIDHSNPPAGPHGSSSSQITTAAAKKVAAAKKAAKAKKVAAAKAAAVKKAADAAYKRRLAQQQKDSLTAYNAYQKQQQALAQEAARKKALNDATVAKQKVANAASQAKVDEARRQLQALDQEDARKKALNDSTVAKMTPAQKKALDDAVTKQKVANAASESARISKSLLTQDAAVGLPITVEKCAWYNLTCYLNNIEAGARQSNANYYAAGTVAMHQAGLNNVENPTDEEIQKFYNSQAAAHAGVTKNAAILHFPSSFDLRSVEYTGITPQTYQDSTTSAVVAKQAMTYGGLYVGMSTVTPMLSQAVSFLTDIATPTTTVEVNLQTVIKRIVGNGVVNYFAVTPRGQQIVKDFVKVWSTPVHFHLSDLNPFYMKTETVSAPGQKSK